MEYPARQREFRRGKSIDRANPLGHGQHNTLDFLLKELPLVVRLIIDALPTFGPKWRKRNLSRFKFNINCLTSQHINPLLSIVDISSSTSSNEWLAIYVELGGKPCSIIVDLLGILDRIKLLLGPSFKPFKDCHGILTSKQVCPMGDRSHSTQDATRLQTIFKLAFSRSMASIVAMKLDKNIPRDTMERLGYRRVFLR